VAYSGRPYRLSIHGANRSIEEVAGTALLLRCQTGRVSRIRDDLLAVYSGRGVLRHLPHPPSLVVILSCFET
jgi:hypothetical protein